jgi:hypothetical protein
MERKTKSTVLVFLRRLRVPLALIGLLLLLLYFASMSPIAAAPSAPALFAGEQLLTGTNNSWEPFIAADPGSSHVYAVWFNPSGPAPCQGCPTSAMMFQSSTDNGVTWNPAQWFCPCTSSRGQYDPTIKVVPGTGVVYLMWMDWNQIMFSKSSDYGQTFTPQIQLSGTQWADHPWFGMSASGQDVYAYWAKGDIYGVASHNFGATWSAPKKINTDKNRQYYAEGVEVLADGTVVASALSYPCSKGTSQCKGIINATTFRSTNLGVSYTQTLVDQLYTGPQWMTNGLETIASDATGNLMLMYSGAASQGANNQMYARRSTDKGVTWGSRTLLSTGPGADACYPAIAGGSSGNFRATYFDNRTSAFNVWYRETTDNGATWSADIKISDKTTGASYKTVNGFGSPYGDYSGISILSSGRTIAIFGEAAPNQAAPGGIWMNRQQ